MKYRYGCIMIQKQWETVLLAGACIFAVAATSDDAAEQLHSQQRPFEESYTPPSSDLSSGYVVKFSGQLMGTFGGCTTGQEFLLSNGNHFTCTQTQQARVKSSPVFQIVQRYGEPEKYIIGGDFIQGDLSP